MALLLDPSPATRSKLASSIWTHPWLDADTVNFWKSKLFDRAAFFAPTQIQLTYLDEVRDLIKLQQNEIVDGDDDED